MKINRARELFNLRVDFSKGDLARAYCRLHQASRMNLEGAPLREEVEIAYRLLFADLKRRGEVQSSEEEDHETEE